MNLMTESYLIKTFFDIVTYKCPYCGTINTFNKPIIDLFLEHKKTHIVCEGCGVTKIKI